MRRWATLLYDDGRVRRVLCYLDILHARTLARLAAARAQSRTGGRPTVMDADKLAANQARRTKGESSTQIHPSTGCVPGQRLLP